MLTTVVMFLLIGAAVGFVAGVFGIGGGVVAVPALAFAFQYMHLPTHYLMHMAAGTSLAVMIFTATASTYMHHRHRHVIWPVWRHMLPGIVIGVVAGASLAHYLPTKIISIIFGIFMLLVAAHLLLGKKKKGSLKLPRGFKLLPVTFTIGFKSGVLGIGGGALTIPYLTYCKVPMKKASGTSAACTLPIAVVGCISFMIAGMFVKTGLPQHCIGYVYWPAVVGVALGSVIFAPIGATVTKHSHAAWLKRVFAMLLIFVASQMLT